MGKLGVKKLSEEELEYICKYVDNDGTRGVADALDRCIDTILKAKKRLIKNGLFEYYKTLNKHW
ncbi:DNA-entry nuclease [Tepidibacter mesophilus]|uniref:DNA-entry nuclease n=1 Tax=Tepidibacter mesophilus TaxID=655607 RepID=UPI000C08C570|nr:DNA-entry nuclease [Tepidibacter mesophilus]